MRVIQSICSSLISYRLFPWFRFNGTRLSEASMSWIMPLRPSGFLFDRIQMYVLMPVRKKISVGSLMMQSM